MCAAMGLHHWEQKLAYIAGRTWSTEKLIFTGRASGGIITLEKLCYFVCSGMQDLWPWPGGDSKGEGRACKSASPTSSTTNFRPPKNEFHRQEVKNVAAAL